MLLQPWKQGKTWTLGNASQCSNWNQRQSHLNLLHDLSPKPKEESVSRQSAAQAAMAELMADKMQEQKAVRKLNQKHVMPCEAQAQDCAQENDTHTASGGKVLVGFEQ